MNEKTPLEIATDRLHSIEQLLISPTPEAIAEADVLLHEVAELMAGFKPGPDAKNTALLAALKDFRVLCDRVGQLLEGARKIQWIRLRLTTLLTETYTARAEKKIWYPPSGSVNLHM